mmetsp:Transcript_38313/g.96384  ORF Transcript_38313/g.96384 Transcript_38313/m.96384 type:complete len:281 (+) Transcript_38313:303-1145(+)
MEDVASREEADADEGCAAETVEESEAVAVVAERGIEEGGNAPANDDDDDEFCVAETEPSASGACGEEEIWVLTAVDLSALGLMSAFPLRCSSTAPEAAACDEEGCAPDSVVSRVVIDKHEDEGEEDEEGEAEKWEEVASTQVASAFETTAVSALENASVSRLDDEEGELAAAELSSCAVADVTPRCTTDVVGPLECAVVLEVGVDESSELSCPAGLISSAVGRTTPECNPSALEGLECTAATSRCAFVVVVVVVVVVVSLNELDVSTERASEVVEDDSRL